MAAEANDNRYDRQYLLPQVGRKGQELLSQASILIVGMGGLGCPAAQYLAAAGIGTLGLMDADCVTASNLNRQILYTANDIGQPKVNAAKQRLAASNPAINIRIYNNRLTSKNALEHIAAYDLLIDGTDNLASKYLINDACVQTDKPWVSASIHQFQGQLSVFNFNGGPTYRCLFPEKAATVRNCEEAGVLGAVAGALGVAQAMEALKIVLGVGKVSAGVLLLNDYLQGREDQLRFTRKEAQIDRARQTVFDQTAMAQPDEHPNAYFLDVREKGDEPQWMHERLLHIPFQELTERQQEIPREVPVWVFCQSGTRSRHAIQYLENKFGFHNLSNVEAGVYELIKKETVS